MASFQPNEIARLEAIKEYKAHEAKAADAQFNMAMQDYKLASLTPSVVSVGGSNIWKWICIAGLVLLFLMAMGWNPFDHHVNYWKF